MGKSSVANALDEVTCGDEVAVAEAQEEVAAVEAASTRLREIATMLQNRLADLEKTGSRIVQVTNKINAEHLASSVSSAPAAEQEQEVAPQRADPKTGLAGGGRKGSKKEKAAKRRKKRASAAAGHLCAHRAPVVPQAVRELGRWTHPVPVVRFVQERRDRRLWPRGVAERTV